MLREHDALFPRLVMEPRFFTGRVAGDCGPAGAAVEVSGTGRSDWRRHETIQRGAENAGSKTAQAGIGNAKQSLLYLWAFVGVRGNFNRNSGKTGLFAPAVASSRRSARDGGLGGIGGNRGGRNRRKPGRPMSRGWFPRPAVAPPRLAPLFSCWTGSIPLWRLLSFSTPITPRIPVGRTSFRE